MPKAFTMPGMMRALKEPTQPNVAMSTKEGTSESWEGTIMVASSRMKSHFLPGNSNFANANPANESKNSTRIVTKPDTNNVFRKAPQKSICCNTRVILFHSSPPNQSWGGNL